MSGDTEAAVELALDLTMNIVNRTAVYDIGHELFALMPAGARARYWRTFQRKPLDLRDAGWSNFAGKAFGRLVFRDFDAASSRRWPWPRRPGAMLFLDPLFCARTPLTADDIVIVHDLAPVSHPEYYDAGAGDSYREAYARIQQARCGLVFVSAFTQRVFMAFYPGDYRFTQVVPLFFKSGLVSASAASPRAKRYVLMVGSLERRKNYPAALAAYADSGLAEQGVELVMVGPRGNVADQVLQNLPPGASHAGFIDAGELAALYRRAEALYFPSLIEGFGLPALEAGKIGLLPIVSKDTVLEDVTGDGAILVDPQSRASMAEGLRAAVGMSTAERARRLGAIAAHQQAFSLDNFRATWSALIAREAGRAA